jgi:hypothetical protein
MTGSKGRAGNGKKRGRLRAGDRAGGAEGGAMA